MSPREDRQTLIKEAKLCLKAAEKKSKEGENISAAELFTSAADCYKGLGDLETAIAYHIKSAETYILKKRFTSAANGFASVAECYEELGDIEKANKYYITSRDNFIEAFRVSEAKLKAILTGIGDLITIQNKDLDIIWINHAIKNVWGRDVIGKKCYEEYKGLTEPCPDCTVETVLSEGKTTVTERTSTLPDGRTIEILTTSSPMRDAVGNIVAVVEVSKDITEQKKAEQDLRKLSHDRGERVKELNCLYGISKLIEKKDISLEELLQGIVELIPPAWQYPEITCGRLIVDDQEYTTNNFKETSWNQASDIIVSGEKVGTFEVFYLEERPEIDEGPFLKEERKLINSMAERTGTIIEHQRAEEKLASEKERLAVTLRSIGDGVITTDTEGRIVLLNKVAEQLTGWTQEEANGKTLTEVFQIINAKTRERCENPVNKVLETGNVVGLANDTVLIARDGTERILGDSAAPIRDKDGKIVGVVLIFRDLTEQKKAEQDLRKLSHDRGERVKELNCLYGISKLVETPGIVLEEILQGIVELIPPAWQYPEITCARIIMNDQEFRTENFRDTIWKQTSDIIMDSDRNGTVEVYYLEEKPELDEGPFLKEERHLIDALAERLGETIQRKRAEEALRESEAKYRSITEHSPDHIMTMDLEYIIIFINRTVPGVTREEMIGKPVFYFIPETYREAAKQCFERVVKSGKADHYFTDFTGPDGVTYYFESRVGPILESGKVMGLTVSGTNITERKQMEERIKEYTENLETMVEERTLELRESEEKFRTLAEQSPSMIFINKKSKVVYVNKRCEELMGYTKEDVYSPDFDFLSLMTPESIEIVKSSFHKHMAGEEVEPYEYTLVTKDGKRIEAIMSSRLIDYEGETAILGIVTDITERKRFEETIYESETRYRGLYDSSMDGIASATTDGKIVECNQAFLDMLGYTKEEVLNLAYEEITAPKWRDIQAKFITEQVLKRGYSDEFEIEGIKKDGTLIPISVRVWLIKSKDGIPTGIWAMARDISERKKIDKMKAEFIDLTAHELRTPLGALKAHVELLKIKSDQGYWTLPKEVHNKINIITRNAKRLTILINNLVDYTRIEAGSLKLKLKLVSIEEVTSKVIKESLPLAQRHKHALTFNVPKPLPLIRMDEDIVGSILNNVISNAIKYTPDGGAIDVMILEEEDNLHITVKDNGVGIAEEDLEKIFRPFYVVDLSQSVLFQSKSEFERLGMGLAIVKEYVAMLGGKIWAESRVGEGSIFHILFPKKK